VAVSASWPVYQYAKALHKPFQRLSLGNVGQQLQVYVSFLNEYNATAICIPNRLYDKKLLSHRWKPCNAFVQYTI